MCTAKHVTVEPFKVQYLNYANGTHCTHLQFDQTHLLPFQSEQQPSSRSPLRSMWERPDAS